MDEPLSLEDGGGEANDESSDEDDEDQDEFVYDIQVRDHHCSINVKAPFM